MKETSESLNAEKIRDCLQYLRRFKNALFVFYIDDEIIDSPLFFSHMKDICLIHQAGVKIILVPGARKRINEILTAYNFKWEFIDNSRIVDEEAMSLIKMAAFDVANKLMTELAAEKITAVIGNWVRSRGKGVINGIDFATCGVVDKIQTEAVFSLLQNDCIPLFPSIGWNAAGKPYNITSAQLASEIAIRMRADKLFFITHSIQKESIFFNEQIPAFNLNELSVFIEKNKDKNEHVFSLLDFASLACKSGVQRVHILDGTIEGSILLEIFSGTGSGLMIYQHDYADIRPMKNDDIPAVLQLMIPFVESGALLPRSAENISTAIDDYIVYEVDGSIRACAALHFYDDNQAEIAALAVSELYKNTGIGPKMLSYLLERAKKNNASCVFALTTKTADWFEQNGFKIADTKTLPQKRKSTWNPERGSKMLKLVL